MSERRALSGLVAVLLLATACTRGHGTTDTPKGSESAAPVRDLNSIETLKTSFNKDAGSVRLVLLLSPT